MAASTGRVLNESLLKLDYSSEEEGQIIEEEGETNGLIEKE